MVVFGWLGSAANALVPDETMVNELVLVPVAGEVAAILNTGPCIGRDLYNSFAGLILGPAGRMAADGTPIHTIALYLDIFLPNLATGDIAIARSQLSRETMDTENRPRLSPSLTAGTGWEIHQQSQ